MAILYQHFGKEINGELKKEASYLSYGVEQDGIDYLKQINEKDDRITYIAEDGTVLYDNMADAEAMENHSERKEVQEALKTGSGYAERTSETLSQKTIYYALRLPDHSVLRVSSTQFSVFVLLMELIPPIIGILIVMLIIAVIVSAHMANKIVEPINNLDLEHPEDNQVYDEVGPLLSKIYKQNRQIKNQLEAARRNQEEFGIITENMQEGLLVIDSYTMILSGNSSVWNMFQLKEAKIGDSVYSLNRNEDFRMLIEQVLKGQHGSVLLHLGNEAIQMIANPVTREHKVVGAVLLLMNETEKVEREQLRREFSANVSHELKTPLTSISGFAEIIQDGLVRAEDIKKFAGRIYDEAQRLITLVEDTIKVSQLDEGENPYEWEQLDAYAVVKDVCGRLKDIAAKKNVHLYIDGDKTMLCTVRPILDEIIYNLCDNGIKYNRDDGTVSIHLREMGENVEIRVKDNGIGIPGEDQNRVFERFYRVDKSHSKAIGGTGLGLSIVKHGVTFLGGTLKMVSEIGKGTEITMTFPKERKAV
nr:ATP-binding protein [uncultured Blautia sp.]